MISDKRKRDPGNGGMLDTDEAFIWGIGIIAVIAVGLATGIGVILWLIAKFIGFVFG